MSKKIHTIQSSDKDEFDKQVNFFLNENSVEILDGTYEIIKKDDGLIYSQVIVIDKNKLDLDFYKNGQKKYEGKYKKQLKVGKWTYWREDGQIKEEGTYKDGKEDGVWTELFNGQKYREKTYKDGKKDGLWTEWYVNGQKWWEGNYKDGKEDGEWIYWDRNGQKNQKETYKDGELDGLYTTWYKNGQKSTEESYKDGERVGLWTKWYENGQKEEEGMVLSDDGYIKLIGKWTYYNKDGSVKEIKDYDKDEYDE